MKSDRNASSNPPSHHPGHGKNGDPAPDHGPNGHQDHQSHHAHMVADFRRRLWISLILTLPILALAPLIQRLLGVQQTLAFPGDGYLQFAFSTLVFFYGGWPFLKGMADELGKKEPGMMTLIALAVTVAYGYSSAVVFGLPGKVFFWELATLIDIMLLGHWIEMRSVMSASGALEELAGRSPGGGGLHLPGRGKRAAGVLYPVFKFLMPPAIGALIMSLSTVIVAINARLLSAPPKTERKQAA